MTSLADDSSAELTLRERLIALVRRILGPPAAHRLLPIDARLADLGMSSLKMVSLMLAMEVEFDIAIPQEEITPDNFVSIASVEAVIQRLRRAAQSPSDP